MSQENVDAFKRAFEADNRYDVEALLGELDPEVEWHPALPALLGRESTIYRGHEGVRELMRELGEAFAAWHMEFPDVRDLGDQIVALGHIRTRGKASGAEIESPLAYVFEFRQGKATRVRAYLDRKQALEAAGLRE
jgi:uncharacterized protein